MGYAEKAPENPVRLVQRGLEQDGNGNRNQIQKATSLMCTCVVIAKGIECETWIGDGGSAEVWVANHELY